MFAHANSSARTFNFFIFLLVVILAALLYPLKSQKLEGGRTSVIGLLG